MDPIILLVAATAAGSVLAVLMAVGSMLQADRHMSSRMDAYLREGLNPGELPAHVSDEEGNALAEQLNTRLNNVGFAEGIRRDLARADVLLTVPEYLLLKVAAMLLPTAVVLLLTRSLLAAPLIALIGFFLPTVWLRQRQSRRQRLFAEQLPDMLATVIGSLRGGFSLVQALGNVGNEAPAPMSTEMRRVMQEIQLGLAVGDALSNLAKRMSSADLDMLVSVLRIHARIGGNLTVVLENINTTIRERSRLQREIRVITSQQRYASYVLGLLPVILGLILMTINPEYMLKLFAPGPLLVIPVGAVILNIAGFLAIQKIVDIKV
ncbi:MAG TPA: type II secretion system F family protein [Chloroflexaceae bacterium]|nr:type II secretion system F family protein [Chloroflexaceae bacterium]